MEVDHDHGLTEFEKERLRRVQRNRQALVELGVQNAIDKLSAQRSQDAGDAKSSNRKRKDRNMEPTPPARRSLRQQGVKLEELAG